jgi:fatty-acyl-CoA synthase
VGVPDEKLQEAGMAFVQLKEGETATESEIVEYCRERVAVFKVPKYVRFVEQFQTTGTGKVQKFLLRQKALLEQQQVSK